MAPFGESTAFASDGGGGSPARGTRRTKGLENHEMPSLKYKDIEYNIITLRRAQSPPKATLPRRPGGRSWAATMRERNPLTSNLTGPGRAGKAGELLGQSGGRYHGEVLAGRPQGHGQFLVPKSLGSTEFVVQYEGDWVQGRREGRGTRYYANGESYTGDWVSNIRHGFGRYSFSDGNVYSGQWDSDKRTGRGTLYYRSGDIFVGNFTRDRREGMGTLYLIARQKKYVAEYVADAPRCGTWLEIDDADLEPLRGQLSLLALQSKMDAHAEGTTVTRLPESQLLQPSKVIAGEIAEVRRQREAGGKALAALQASSGTLSYRDVEMLRHSFTLMAAGDGPEVGLLPHQLRELCVMAGLDPAAPSTWAIVEDLLNRKHPATNRISFDTFMKVVVHYQDEAVVGGGGGRDDGQAAGSDVGSGLSGQQAEEAAGDGDYQQGEDADGGQWGGADELLPQQEDDAERDAEVVLEGEAEGEGYEDAVAMGAAAEDAAAVAG